MRHWTTSSGHEVHLEKNQERLQIDRNRGGINGFPNRALNSISASAIKLYLKMQHLSHTKFKRKRYEDHEAEYKGYILISSIRELAAVLGYSRGRVRRALRVLEDHNIIVIDKAREQRTLYLFTPSSEWIL